MPKDPQVAHNYAEALLQVTQKQGMSLSEAFTEAQSLQSLLREQPKMYVFLAGPQFREESKETVVQTVFQGRLSDVFYCFLLMLLRRDRIEHLPDILEVFQERVEAVQGVTPGTVTTAVPLSEDEQAHFQKKLETACGRSFVLRFKVDSRLIGGVMVKYGDVLLDTTLAMFLSDLRRRLSETRLAS